MRLSLACTAYMDLSLEDAIARVQALGLDAIELAVDTTAVMLDVDELLDAGARARVTTLVDQAGLAITALSNHGDGQLLLGPLHAVTDGFYRGTPAEKQAYARERMKNTARAADALGVRVVTGFIGCPDYARWFHWPGEPGWEAHYEEMERVISDVLAVYRHYGVRFAHELHPKQLVYEPASAQRSLDILGGFAEWGFNLDTGNLALAGVDPVEFIRLFGERIFYVHAKDAESVRPATRDHFIAHPSYHGEVGRNFRFRIPGWGDLDWRRIMTELNLAGYRGTVAVENEDTTIGRWEGCRLAIDHVRPLLLCEERQARWW